MKKNKLTKGDKATDRYSVTEVGTMLESIHKEVKTIAEGHSGLDKRLERLEVAAHGTNRRIDSVDFRLMAIEGSTERLEDAVSKLNKDVANIDSELKETRQELGSKIDQVGERLAVVEARN